MSHDSSRERISINWPKNTECRKNVGIWVKIAESTFGKTAV